MPDLSDGKTMAEIFAQIAQWAPLTPDRVKSAAWMLRSIFFSKMNIIYLYAEVNLIDRAEDTMLFWLLIFCCHGGNFSSMIVR